jgi:hypothetical protein
MTAKTDLMGMRTELLTSISELAREGNSSALIQKTDQLRRIDTLIERYAKLEEEVKQMTHMNTVTPRIAEQEQPTTSVTSNRNSYPQAQEQESNARTEGRASGPIIRNEFMRELKDHGISLRQTGRVTFVTMSRKRVGMAVSNETAPNGWFLGLKKGSFDVAVLLCKTRRGDLVPACLPESFFESYLDRLSYSGEDLKFTVRRRGANEYFLQVPPAVDIPLKPYIRSYDCLR